MTGSGWASVGGVANAARCTSSMSSPGQPNYDLQSEEDPQNIAVGEQFAASVINAVMSSPL